MEQKYSIFLGLHQRQVTLQVAKSIPINVNSADSLIDLLAEIKPQLIVHTAGLTNVEECERKPQLAKEINVQLAGNVAKAAKCLNIKFVHISTDHLFDGTMPKVSEKDPIAPLNQYGKTKGEAEHRVLSINESALVVRTNFYGWGPSYRPSFSDMIINNLRSGKEITLFDDVFYTSILAKDLVETTHDLIDRNAAGIFHVVGDERISKYEFGLKIAKAFELDASLILPKSIKTRLNLVQRPLDMSLCNRKVCEFLGRNMGSSDQHIASLKEQEKSNIYKEITKL